MTAATKKSPARGARSPKARPRAAVELAGPRGAEVARILDADGRVVVEYDGASGALTLHAPGDLRLHAPNGSIALHARDGVTAATAGAAVHVSPDAVQVQATALRQVVGVAELHAQRVIERAGDVYREARGLSQTCAERVRLVASQAMYLLGQRALVKTTDDLKLRAKQIHLG